MNTKKSPSKRTAKPARGRKRLTIAAVIKAIQKSLTPDLLKPQFREGNATNPLFGHCYHSAEALYHLIRELQLPEEYCGFRPCRGVEDNGIPHWWLQNERGAILDPTAGQYTSKGVGPPYTSGRPRPFLTKQPSKRAQALIARVRRLIENGVYL